MRQEFTSDLIDIREFFLRLPNEKPIELIPRMSNMSQKLLLFISGIYTSFTHL